MPRLSIIVAMSENRVIGRGNQLPWHLPADLQHFKQLTTGHAIVMGRKTFESIGRPLPNRRSIVTTRRSDYHPSGVEIAHSFDEAIGLTSSDEEVFVIGGAEVFREALPRADRLYLTVVHATIQGDVFLPEFDLSQWKLVDERRHEADDKHAYAFSFRHYERNDSRSNREGGR